VRAHLLGVRGSLPTPGPSFVRYGGNTSCVALAHDALAPTLVLDAGTGLRGLTATLAGSPFDGSLLLTHLHWDHVEGLPFCEAVDRQQTRCDLYLPEQPDGTEAVAVLARMMSPPTFPIGPEGLLGSWTFSSLKPGQYELEGFSVTAGEIAHKGGTTYGYRITDGSSSLAYLPDHCPTSYGPGPDRWGEFPRAVEELVGGVDVLIHDAQLTADQLPEGSAFGHSAMEYAVALGRHAEVSTVVLYHHSPNRTDEQLDEVADRYRSHVDPLVVVAVEGTVIECRAGASQRSFLFDRKGSAPSPRSSTT
jgi:phosphoribosyl 1,2-cyclic phosphodiesterase